jgi:hypothetical protein
MTAYQSTPVEDKTVILKITFLFIYLLFFYFLLFHYSYIKMYLIIKIINIYIKLCKNN